MPKAVVCRELGPPERLRLESFASAPLAPGEVRVAVHAAGINFPVGRPQGDRAAALTMR